MILNSKAAFVTFLVFANLATIHAVLRGNRNLVDPTEELHTVVEKTRLLKDSVEGAKTNKGTKRNTTTPTASPTDAELFELSSLPTGSPSASPTTTNPTGLPTSSPTDEATGSPTGPPTEMPSIPTAAPTPEVSIDFDSTIVVVCQPDGATTILTQQEAGAKTIVCNANKPSCRNAVTAVRESKQLQNFFGCAGNLGEGAARKLFNKYACDDRLAEHLALIVTTKTVLVTERPDAMKEACVAIGMAQSPPTANPCCQGDSGCTSVTGSASNSPPFMTVAITACTGDSACKDIGPNPLILDSSCTGASACESMNQNVANPSITGITFVSEVACTSARSCEGVGHQSLGDVIIQNGSCIGSDACNAAGRRAKQPASSFRFRSHIEIGSNACVGNNACKDAHSTVNRSGGGKRRGSLAIGDGGCARRNSCEGIGFSDLMRTDIVVPPDGCNNVSSCRGCMTQSECMFDEVYLISDADGACPKRGSNRNPTGEKVEEFCVGTDTLPTDCPTFSPTPFPTSLTSSPTSTPTVRADLPSSAPSRSQGPSDSPSDSPSSLPSSPPSNFPSGLPSDSPSDLPSHQPSATPSVSPSDIPSSSPSVLPSGMPSNAPSDLPSNLPSTLPSDMPSRFPSQAPTTSNSPTIPPASMQIGCLEGPGDTTSMFNLITDEVLCDGATGTCANFVSMVDALPDKGKMIKSIFGCNDEDPPQTLSLEMAQERFDKIKNDASVTGAILDVVNEGKKLFTGNATLVTAACGTDCCNGNSACVADSTGSVMTVSTGSCIGNMACNDEPSDTIILDSCKGFLSCAGVGFFSPTQPLAGVEVGFRVIGPRACTATHSCLTVGRNVFGNVRVEEGACNAESGCSRVGARSNQDATVSPTVASIFVGKNACQGTNACNVVHGVSGFGPKTAGSLIIEEDACNGENACNALAFINSAVNDITIKQGICKDVAGLECTGCARGQLCGGDPTKTYVIDDEGEDCPGPFAASCVQSNSTP